MKCNNVYENRKKREKMNGYKKYVFSGKYEKEKWKEIEKKWYWWKK